jgi:AraC family transcriptional regulator
MVEGCLVDVWTPGFRAFDFTCPPASAAWGRDNETGDCWLFAFPHHQVAIGSAGQADVVADPSLVMIYPPGQHFRRRIVDPRGDRCDVVGVDGGCVAGLSGDQFLESATSVTWLPVENSVLLRQRVLFRRLQTAPIRPARRAGLAIADEVTRLLRHVLAGPRPQTSARRVATQAHHRELVERARHHLGRDLAGDLDLAELARAVGTAPHHLARVFRAGTGSSLHAYRVQLRLRAALDAILAGAPVGETAHVLGFSSHAHLTSTFRAVFGRPPSSLLDPDVV